MCRTLNRGQRFSLIRGFVNVMFVCGHVHLHTGMWGSHTLCLALLAAAGTGFGAGAPPCSDQEFQCISQECVSPEVVCDYHRDCSDGSDEGLCGPCDFDRHACGWKDASIGTSHWMLELANVSAVPGADHTTGSPFGGMMHMEGSRPSLFGEARLELVLHRHTALACQISFWYHLYDAVGVSSELSLHMISGSTSKEMWKVKRGQSEGWEKARVYMGSLNAGSKLRFSVKPSPIGEQDVALDDVSFKYCSMRDPPENSSNLSCSFEDSSCAWYAEEDTGISWRRSNGTGLYGQPHGPGHDHTTGSGYYMFVALKSNSAWVVKPRLLTYPQAAGVTRCISFWYLLHGGSTGSLEFISKQASGPEVVEWVRAGTQGNKWHFADLQVERSDAPVQFVFQVAVNGSNGVVAVDDVTVSEAVKGACPAERECSFQSSRCGLRDDPTGHFNWTRTSGEHSANAFSPAYDHTLGTSHGYYLSAYIWKQPAGFTGRVVTPVREPTPLSGECLKFWYHMQGEGLGLLNIYLEAQHGFRELLWSREGDQGNEWRLGAVTILSHSAPYKMTFEAVSGQGAGMDIALDDVLLLNGHCAPVGFCDFESDLCGWMNSRPMGPSVEWDWTFGSGTDSSYAPPVDHTTNSNLGYYLHFSKKLMTPGQTAYLWSDYQDGSAAGCVTFWYHMHLHSSLDDVTLSLYMNDSRGLGLLWNVTRESGQVWKEARVDYNASGRHRILLQAKATKSFHAGDIAVDDIDLAAGVSCADHASTTPAPTVTLTTATPETPMDCSFEEGLCRWLQETGSQWVRQKGRDVISPDDGPRYDHSLSSEHGSYLVISSPGPDDGEQAVISIPMMLQTTDVCLGFWYYMLGSSVPRLELLLQTNESDRVAWSRWGTQSAEWLPAQVTISLPDIQKVKVSGQRTLMGKGFIAIDDITARQGPCKEQDSCGFESPSLCGYEQDVTDSAEWVHTTGSADQVDWTYRTQLGHYMAVYGERQEERKVAMLRSPEFPATAESCVRFWYWMSSSGSLTVRAVRSEEPGRALWSFSGSRTQSWEVAEVTVSSPTRFRVGFRAELDGSPDSSVLLDEVSVRDGACAPTGSCDFESGLCTWSNLHSSGQNWVHADGHFGGPGLDHTTETPEGMYLLSQALPHSQGKTAVLLSERFQASGVCLALWYYNSGRSGLLRGYIRSDDTKGDLFFVGRGGENGWTKFSVTLQGPKGFQVLLEAEMGSYGFIAIDDLQVAAGPCVGNETLRGFVGCDFEADLCGWTDVSVGQFAWARDRNGTPTDNTGPSVDHTTGTELGWYVAVEADHGQVNSYGALQSPAMTEAASPCVLKFHYHMFGEGIGQLSVQLQHDSRLTQIWHLSGDQGQHWMRGVVGLARIPGVFRLLFKATRTFSTLGDIALDDIAFHNCSLPEPQDWCPHDMSRCSNGVCVSPNHLCDFSDDCGDHSDETDCDLLGFHSRCSFEDGLCTWQRSDFDMPGAEWTLQKAEESRPGQGPMRDHTRNSGAGHYAIPAGLVRAWAQSEMLSNTLLASSGCSVRFYHCSPGTLTLRLRTVHSSHHDRVLWVSSGGLGLTWERVEISFSSTSLSKVVFRFESGEDAGAYATVDDVSFSPQCAHDPTNSLLPEPPSTPPPTSPNSPAPSVDNCTAEEFFCWLSGGATCVPARSRCDSTKDCPLGEDEQSCGLSGGVAVGVALSLLILVVILIVTFILLPCRKRNNRSQNVDMSDLNNLVLSLHDFQPDRQHGASSPQTFYVKEEHASDQSEA